MISEKIDFTNRDVKYQFTAYLGFVESDFALLISYKNAIDIIVKHLKKTKTPIDIVAHPFLYLMRHSLELGYKSNFSYLKNYSCRETIKTILQSHNLKVLHEEFKEHFDAIAERLKFESDLIFIFYDRYTEVIGLIEELEKDEASAFRYTHNPKGKKIFDKKVTKDISSIKDVYDKAVQMLMHTVDLIAPKTNYADLIKIRPRYKNNVNEVLMKFEVSQKSIYSSHLSETFTKIGRLKWKDLENQTLKIITIGNICYLAIENKPLTVQPF